MSLSASNSWARCGRVPPSPVQLRPLDSVRFEARCCCNSLSSSWNSRTSFFTRSPTSTGSTSILPLISGRTETCSAGVISPAALTAKLISRSSAMAVVAAGGSRCLAGCLPVLPADNNRRCRFRQPQNQKKLLHFIENKTSRWAQQRCNRLISACTVASKRLFMAVGRK